LFVKQSTLNKVGCMRGVGLHTGKKVNLKLIPSKDNFGIIFRRVDLLCPIDIPAVFSNVVNTEFSTVLKQNGVYVKTVEHLLSAIFSLGIDNILIEMDSDEVPIMDGSSYPFIYLLLCCGIKVLNEPKKFLKIKKELMVSMNNKFILVSPCDKFSVSIGLNLSSFNIFNFFNFEFSFFNYLYFISRARTFGFYEQYKNLLACDLAKGASFDNVLVFYEGNILNKNMARYNDEFLRHKVLDFLGDISLIGKGVIGSFLSNMPSHKLNNKLLNILFFQPNMYDLVLLHRSYGFILY